MSAAIINYVGALALAALLALGTTLDGPTDYSAELQQADYLLELQNAARAQRRMELAGQAACEELRGYNTTAQFDADGVLFCAAGQTVVKASL